MSVIEYPIRLDLPAYPPRTAAIWGLGDSITRNGYEPPTNNIAQQYGAQSYLLWACIHSQGALRLGGISAQGGATTREIIDNYLPAVLAAKPAYCVVHAGTNDIGVLSTAQTLTNFAYMFDTLLAAGITPIGTTMLPKQTTLGADRRPLLTMSAFVIQYGIAKNFPVADFAGAVIDPATSGWAGYGSNQYNIDNVHPNGAGAKALGHKVWDVLAKVLPPRPAFMPQYNTQGHADDTHYFFPTFDNALSLNDTNSDGVPDRWTPNSGAGVSYAITAMSGAEGVGNWFTSTQGSNSTNPFPQAISDTALIAGHRMLFTMKIKASVKTAGAKWNIKAMDNTYNTIFGITDITEDVTLGGISVEWVVPAGAADLSHLRFVAYPDGMPGSGSASLSIGQIGVYDLTAMGIA